MVVSFLFHIRDIYDENEVLGLTLGVMTCVSIGSLATSIVHAIFISLMINEFGSLDELTLFTIRIGTLSNLPAQFFIVGMWSGVLTMAVYLFSFIPVRHSAILIVTMAIVFSIGHILITYVMQSFYFALRGVDKGFRVEPSRQNPKGVHRRGSNTLQEPVTKGGADQHNEEEEEEEGPEEEALALATPTQSPNDAASTMDPSTMLMERMDRLEQENKELRQKLKSVESRGGSA
mmetsp:Transcript_79504/g.226998  ORF Transcript_79504/g.226998 Transcript_79504/m.226998 type:complete len:233 (+) Transcript_79504:482-1180(+)